MPLIIEECWKEEHTTTEREQEEDLTGLKSGHDMWHTFRVVTTAISGRGGAALTFAQGGRGALTLAQVLRMASMSVPSIYTPQFTVSLVCSTSKHYRLFYGVSDTYMWDVTYIYIYIYRLYMYHMYGVSHTSIGIYIGCTYIMYIQHLVSVLLLLL